MRVIQYSRHIQFVMQDLPLGFAIGASWPMVDLDAHREFGERWWHRFAFWVAYEDEFSRRWQVRFLWFYIGRKVRLQ